MSQSIPGMTELVNDPRRAFVVGRLRAGLRWAADALDVLSEWLEVHE